MALYLYGTQGCHLCEKAEALYQDLNKMTSLKQIDIAYDDHLFVRYGVTIPVISWQDSEKQILAELSWPFDSLQLQTWLVKHGIN